TRDEHHELGRVAEANASATDHVVRFPFPFEPKETLGEPDVPRHRAGLDLSEAEVLIPRLFESAALEEPTRKVGPCGNEAGVDLERLAVVSLRLFPDLPPVRE